MPAVSSVAGSTSALSSVRKRAYPLISGGTLTSDNTYYYRTFTANGTLTVLNSMLDISVLIVSGGGGGSGGKIIYDICYNTCFSMCYDYSNQYTYQCNPFACNPYDCSPSNHFSSAGAGSMVSTENIKQSTGNIAIVIGAGGAGSAGVVRSLSSPSTNNTTGGNGTKSSYAGVFTSNAGDGARSNDLGGTNGIFSSSGRGGAGATASASNDNGGAGSMQTQYGTSSVTYGVGGSASLTTLSAAGANTGNGGMSGHGNNSANIVNGGSGIVVVRYLKSAVS
jgi:hypothetical protein